MADASASEAKAWMVKAWRDLETARRAATGEPPFYDVAVYHCQQAAEKAVKAFLVHHGKPYEKTHDIEVLVDLACGIESGFGKLADAADALHLAGTEHCAAFVSFDRSLIRRARQYARMPVRPA